eukprot:3534298-Amphidinium_carterae.1
MAQQMVPIKAVACTMLQQSRCLCLGYEILCVHLRLALAAADAAAVFVGCTLTLQAEGVVSWTTFGTQQGTEGSRYH